MSVVVGVDPGSAGTGLAVIDTTRREVTPDGPVTTIGGAALLESLTVYRPDHEPVTSPSPAYLAAVTTQVAHLVTMYGATLVAVEGVLAPNPHVNRANGKATTNPAHIIAAGMVFGAVVARGYGARLIVVRPGNNGSHPLGTYPAPLVSDAERRTPGWRGKAAGRGKLKDARSAYDVAVLGHQLRGLLPTRTYTY